MNQATHNEPALADLHMQFAQVYVADHKFDKALAEVAAASVANPNDKITYEYLRAAIYDRASQPEMAKAARIQAASEVQAELRKEPPTAEMTGMLAYPRILAMSIDGDDEDSSHEVVTFLEPLVSGGSLKPLDLYTLGFAECTLGRAAECRRHTEAAINANQKLNTAESHHHLAQALQKAGDPIGAFDHFRQAYELDPENMTYRMDYESSKQ